MGWYYNYGTSNKASFDEALKQIDQKMNEVEANDDGSIDFEVIIKGKTERRVSFTSQNGAEVSDIIKMNVQ